jgi:hypothetical protein
MCSKPASVRESGACPKRVVREQRLGFVVTVNADGTPNVSPRATFIVLVHKNAPVRFVSKGFGPSRRAPAPLVQVRYCLQSRAQRDHQWRIEKSSEPSGRAYGRASRIMLNGVSAARRTLRNPPAVMTSQSLASPACAPSPAPTSCDSEVGRQIIVEPA